MLDASCPPPGTSLVPNLPLSERDKLDNARNNTYIQVHSVHLCRRLQNVGVIADTSAPCLPTRPLRHRFDLVSLFPVNVTRSPPPCALLHNDNGLDLSYGQNSCRIVLIHLNELRMRELLHGGERQDDLTVHKVLERAPAAGCVKTYGAWMISYWELNDHLPCQSSTACQCGWQRGGRCDD